MTATRRRWRLRWGDRRRLVLTLKGGASITLVGFCGGWCWTVLFAGKQSARFSAAYPTQEQARRGAEEWANEYESNRTERG